MSLPFAMEMSGSGQEKRRGAQISKYTSAVLTTAVAVLSIMAAFITLREFSNLIKEWGLYLVGGALILGLIGALVALLSTTLRVYAINLIVLATVTLGLAAAVPYLPADVEELSLDAMSVYGAISRGNPDEIKRYFDAGVRTDMTSWWSMLLSGMLDEDFFEIARSYPDDAVRFCDYLRLNGWMEGYSRHNIAGPRIRVICP